MVEYSGMSTFSNSLIGIQLEAPQEDLEFGRKLYNFVLDFSNCIKSTIAPFPFVAGMDIYAIDLSTVPFVNRHNLYDSKIQGFILSWAPETTEQILIVNMGDGVPLIFRSGPASGEPITSYVRGEAFIPNDAPVYCYVAVPSGNPAPAGLCNLSFTNYKVRPMTYNTGGWL